MSSPHVCIVGGGIAGLSAAWHALQLQPDARVTLLEASGRVGGKLRTVRIHAPEGDYVCEAGAESFVRRTPELWQLVCEIGIADAAVPARDAVGMHIVKSGRIIPAPISPAAFLASPLMSLRGKLRMLSEPFRAARRDGGDETMAAFVERRFGREALDELLGPVIGGIYSADPHTQSVFATMASMHEAERLHGSVVCGMLRGARTPATKSPAPRGAFAFPGGVDAFVGALVDALRAKPNFELRLDAPALGLRMVGADVVLRLHDDELRFDAVILAVPASAAAHLLIDAAPDAARLLAQMHHRPIGTAVMAYRAADVPVARRVRGVIVPRRERRRIDAVMFASHKRPQCAPPGCALLRVFFGGADPAMTALHETGRLEAIRSELHELFGIVNEPLHVHTSLWSDGFVHAPVGHRDRVREIEALLPSALYVTGASYYGLGVADCVRAAQRCAAAAVDNRLRSSSPGGRARRASVA